MLIFPREGGSSPILGGHFAACLHLLTGLYTSNQISNFYLENFTCQVNTIWMSFIITERSATYLFKGAYSISWPILEP